MPHAEHAPGGAALSRRARLLAAASVLVLLAGCATTPQPEVRDLHSRPLGAAEPSAAPPTLEKLQNVPRGTGDAPTGAAAVTQERIRLRAMEYGAQGGLAARSHEINRDLEHRARDLDQTFAFRALTLTAPGGALVLPPVVTDGRNAATVEPGGQTASMANRVIRIEEPGKIALREPDWRHYLVRRWRSPDEPNRAELPKTSAEREIWKTAVAEGWEAGRRQADMIFEDDMHRLERDFVGMTTYHDLVGKGMITQFVIAENDRGITGGGDEMRVGDRAVRIVVPARLNGRAQEWQPIVIRGGQPAGRR